MIAVPDLLIIALLLWLLLRRPKHFRVLWLVMQVVAIVFIGSILFAAFYLQR
ncbi:MAG: hypothetical protein LBU96_07095 [Yokenella regensburgei]|jgi:hypothetical protein|nr:hypothetical protein [Yokenella regensburgei]